MVKVGTVIRVRVRVTVRFTVWVRGKYLGGVIIIIS